MRLQATFLRQLQYHAIWRQGGALNVDIDLQKTHLYQGALIIKRQKQQEK